MAIFGLLIIFDVLKFVMSTLEARVQMTILTKWYTFTGNQGTRDKLNQIHNYLIKEFFLRRKFKLAQCKQK